MVGRAFQHPHLAGAANALLTRKSRLRPNGQQAFQQGLTGADLQGALAAHQRHGVAGFGGRRFLGGKVFAVHTRRRQAEGGLLISGKQGLRAAGIHVRAYRQGRDHRVQVQHLAAGFLVKVELHIGTGLALVSRQQVQKARMLAESEGSRALIDAENALSTPVLHMKLEQYRLDRMPEIMSHMMKPIEKIDSIRINHVSGFGASQGGSGGGADEGGGGGGKPPVTQVMDSILGMALQLPALKSIGDQIGIDLSGSIDAAKGNSSSGNK